MRKSRFTVSTTAGGGRTPTTSPVSDGAPEAPTMADDHHEEDRPDYDPEHVEQPVADRRFGRRPHETSFTMSQVARGSATAGRTVITFGIALTRPSERQDDLAETVDSIFGERI
ncbi:hypothetical protein C9J85_07070 [Haloferax sp. wsp5]|nr:hypothetical protein C9J85_07070 [Haloferax sp. wsp5]